MKNLFILFGMISLSACGAVKTVAEDAAASEEMPAAIAAMQGKWFSPCVDFSGVGTDHRRFYAVVEGYEETFLAYRYGSSVGCIGSPTTEDLQGNPTSTPALILTMVDAFEPSGMPSGYFAYSFYNPGEESTIRLTLAYLDGEDLYTPMESIDVPDMTNSGAAWSDWITSDSGRLGAFGADHTAGMGFAKVDEQP